MILYRGSGKYFRLIRTNVQKHKCDVYIWPLMHLKWFTKNTILCDIWICSISPGANSHFTDLENWKVSLKVDPKFGTIVLEINCLNHMGHIVGRGFLTSLFYEDPPSLYCLPPLFQILSNHHFLLPPTSTPLLFLLSCLFGWMGDRATFYVSLNEIMGLHMYVKPWYLAPKGPCCVFYATRCQVYWGLPCVVFCFYVKVADP